MTGTRPLAAARQAAGLWRVARAGAGAHRSNPLRVARIARRVRRRQGFEYAEALRVGALDPRLPDPARAALVSRHAFIEAQRPLNAGNEVGTLTGDKVVFHRLCEAAGIPVPRLFGVLDTRGSGYAASGRIIAGPADRAAFVAEDLPPRFVVKPSEGYAGRGVRIVTRRPDGTLECEGRSLTVEELWAELRAQTEFATWIVQERLVNHAALVGLGGDAGLHGVRVTTLVGRDGAPRILFAMLKLALGGGVSDNFVGGAAGNGVAEVSIPDGRLRGLRTARPDAAGYDHLSDSPLTGARLEGMTLPDWDAATATVLAAAPHFLPYRALGWDVALTPDGPVVIEANIRWLPMPFPSMRGVLDQLVAEGGERT